MCSNQVEEESSTEPGDRCAPAESMEELQCGSCARGRACTQSRFLQEHWGLPSITAHTGYRHFHQKNTQPSKAQPTQEKVAWLKGPTFFTCFKNSKLVVKQYLRGCLPWHGLAWGSLDGSFSTCLSKSTLRLALPCCSQRCQLPQTAAGHSGLLACTWVWPMGNSARPLGIGHQNMYLCSSTPFQQLFCFSEAAHSLHGCSPHHAPGPYLLLRAGNNFPEPSVPGCFSLHPQFQMSAHIFVNHPFIRP